MGVSYSQIVNVIPGVLPAGGNALDLTGLFLTQNSSAPTGQVLRFPNQSSVASYFGSGSDEAKYATNYFNSYDNSFSKPGALLFARYPLAAIAGFLRGGSLASISLTVLKTYSGVLTLTVGGTAFTSSTINLTAATSFSNAATIIQAAFTSPTFAVTYDSNFNAFVFTSNASGAAATMTFASGTLSANLLLTSATGATVSNGADAAVASTFLDSIVSITNNWVSFGTIWEATATDKQGFATWTNSKNNRYLYASQDSDPNALVANTTSTFAYWMNQNQISGVAAIAGTTVTAAHAAFVMGYAASLNFDRANGRTTLFGRTQAGLAPTVTTDTQYSNALANGYLVYAGFSADNPANNANLASNGTVSGKFLWLDTYVNQIWLNANIQQSIVQGFQSYNSLPYNAKGYGYVRTLIQQVAQQAVNFGAIQTGVKPSPAQISQMTAVLNLDPSNALYRSGYYIQVSDPGAVARQARKSPIVTLYYMDGGSIQQVTMSSIAVL